MTLPRGLRDQMVAHARSELPNEACGLLGGRDGAATSFHPARNVHEDPFMRYSVDPLDYLRIQDALDDAGEELLAIYHSHPRTHPVPSATDQALVGLNTGVVFIILSLEHEEPELRAWRLDGRETADEVPLTIA